MRHGQPGLDRDDATFPAEHLALLPRSRAHRRWRHQRRERDAGRLPRLRHLRRDHGARRGGADGVRAAAPLSPSHRIDGAAAAAARAAGRRQQRPHQSAARERHRRGLPDGARRAGAAAAAAVGAGLGLFLHARPQPAGRRLRRRAGDVGGAAAAVHRLGHRMGRGAPADLSAPLDRHRHAAGAGHRHRLGAARLSVHDDAHRAPAPASAGRSTCAERALLRHGRVLPGAGRDHADPHGPGPPIDPQPSLGHRAARARREGSRAGTRCLAAAMPAPSEGAS